MNIQILDKTKKKKFIEKISYLGIEKFNFLLMRSGSEKLRAYSGSLSVDEIIRIWTEMRVESIGLYFGKETEDETRLTLDAMHILKDQITKNIIEVNSGQEEQWFFGKDIELTEEQREKYKDVQGFVAIKSDGDIIGNGKISSDKKMISNFLPKERRIRPRDGMII